MSITLRALRLAEAERDAAALALADRMDVDLLAALFRSVIRVYELRSKWTKRRKGARSNA